MNDFSPDDLKEFLKYLHEAGLSLQQTAKAGEKLTEIQKKAESRAATFGDNLDKLSKKAMQNTATMGGLFKEMVSGQKKFKDLTHDLDSLNERIETLNEQIDENSKLSGAEAEERQKALMAERAKVREVKVLVESTVEHNKQLQQTTNLYAGLSSTLTKGVMGAFTGAAKSALSGSDALTTATGFMTAGIDMANNASQAGSKALTDFGQGAMGAGGKLGKFGAAATVAGTALSFLSSTTSELAKAGIGFMLSQTQKLISGFQSASQAGAVYAGGMMDMIKTSTDAGMTLDQFGKSIAENRDQFVKSGLGISDGSKRMADAMKAGGRAARDGMFALGMSMEEQGDAYATVIARAAGPMGKLSVSSAVVAQLTQEYAGDLKLISDLTGKSAAEQKKLAEERTNEFRMQQELAKMGNEDRVRAEAAIAGMTEDSAKALKDRVQNFGAVTDTNMAIMEAASPTLRQYHQEQYQLFKAGKLTADADQALKEKYRTSIQKELAAREDLGQASAHGLSGFNALATGVMKEFAQGAGKSVADSKKNIEAQQKKGKTGKGMEAELMGTQQNFAMQMQKIAEDNLPSFAKALTTTIESIQGAVGALAGGGVAAGTFFGDLKTAIITAVASALGPVLIARMAAGKMAGGAAGGAAGALTGPAVGGALGGPATGGMLTGIANGLKVFANPQTLVGAAGLGAAIAAIGAGIAGATWLMGKALPTLAEGLSAFADLPGENLLNVGKGVGALGAGLAVFGVGGLAGSLGSIAQNLTDAIAGFFGAQTPLEKFVEFSNLQIDGAKAKLNAEAFLAFAQALSTFTGAASGVGTAVATAAANFFGINPPFEQLVKFSSLNIDAVKVKANAEAFAALGNALSVYKGAAASVSSIVATVASNFFGIKLPYSEFAKFSKLAINADAVKANAEAFTAFATAMAAYTGAAASVSSIVATAASDFFGVKLPFDQFVAFSALDIKADTVKLNAEAFTAFATAMASFTGAAAGLGSMVATAAAEFFGVQLPIDQFVAFSGLQIDAAKSKLNAEAFTAFATAMSAYSGVATTFSSVIAASAAEFFGVQLPIDQFVAFSGLAIDADRVKLNAEAFTAFANALALYKGTGAGVGAVIAGWASSFFKQKPPLDALEEFGKLKIDAEGVKRNAESLTAFANTLTAFGQVGGSTNTILDQMGFNLQGIIDKFSKVKPSADIANKGFKEVEDRIKSLSKTIKDADQPITGATGGAKKTAGASSGSLSNVMSGALAGGAAGAVAGSIVPGVGTLAGGAIGAIAGGISGAVNAPTLPKPTEAGAGTPVKGSVDQVLATIRKRESSNNYEAQAKGSTASGAYQFINSTWASLAKKFGIGQEYQRAKDAPPGIQDSLASKYVSEILDKNKGDISKVPLVWYTGNAQGQMSAAALAANAGLTPETYQAKWMADFNKIAGSKTAMLAEGGITNGPSVAGEAGPEAVVPLPDGRTIPVRMDMAELVEKLDEMIRVLKDQHSTSEKILQVSA